MSWVIGGDYWVNWTANCGSTSDNSDDNYDSRSARAKIEKNVKNQSVTY